MISRDADRLPDHRNPAGPATGSAGMGQRGLRIFVEQLKNLASPGDLLLAISGSGNSPNILKAVEWSNQNRLVTVGITGFGGGKLKGLARHNVHAGIDDMGIVESLHQVVFHWIIDDLYRRISGVAAEPLAVGAT